MVHPAVVFAESFDRHFQGMTLRNGHSEIHLFKAMHKALLRAGSGLSVEEYHGGSRQVKFICNASYAHTVERCELSDLLIIVYSPLTGEVRLTYLQAKSERKSVASPCNTKFSADLVQWFLLSSRPVIRGVGAFSPPKNLLSGAVLPSVGSFGFFYKVPGRGFQIYFAVANYLSPPVIYSQPKGRLQPRGQCALITAPGHVDCQAASDNFSFAENLYRMHIGTPIHPRIAHASDTREWLAANLRYQIQQASKKQNQDVSLAQELLEILGPEDKRSLSKAFGAKHLLIVKSDD